MSLAPDSFLVTGGAGFLGASLVLALVDRGHQVRILDNSFRGSRRKLGNYIDRVEFVEGDIRDFDVVRRATFGVRNVCHLAAINGTRYFYEMPEQVLEVGVAGTLNALRAAQEAKVETFTFTSSSEVYQTPPVVPTPEDVPMCIPDPFNPRYSYGGSKLLGEIMVANMGRGRFRTAIVRPHNIYGADMGTEHVIPEFAMRLRRLTRGAPPDVEIAFPIQGSGAETRAFCHIEDFTDGLVRVIDSGEDQTVYHVGNDEEISIKSLAYLIAASMGFQIRLEHQPARAGGTLRRCPDIGKLRHLGYRPQRPIAGAIGEVVRWYSAWADQLDAAT